LQVHKRALYWFSYAKSARHGNVFMMLIRVKNVNSVQKTWFQGKNSTCSLGCKQFFFN